MFIDYSLKSYLDVLGSRAEIPGGGSAAALTGAIGVACAQMAANFSLDPQKFAANAKETAEILRELNFYREKLEKIIDDDAVAFQKFGEVYAMPKQTAEEKSRRQVAMQIAFNAALLPPLAVMQTAADALAQLPRLAETGNKNLITDIGTAAILLNAAAQAARLNVLINVKFLTDLAAKQAYADRVEILRRDCEQSAARVIAAVELAVK